MDKSESKYPLIEKWLGLIIRNELMTAAYNTPMANAGYVTYVRADDLEAALQKGCVGKYLGRQECLTIYLPLKVQTKEERALAILSEIYASDVLPKYLDDQIGKLLEEK